MSHRHPLAHLGPSMTDRTLGGRSSLEPHITGALQILLLLLAFLGWACNGFPRPGDGQRRLADCMLDAEAASTAHQIDCKALIAQHRHEEDAKRNEAAREMQRQEAAEHLRAEGGWAGR